MSRSYKKNPWCGDKKGTEKKRTANHKIRSWLKQHPEEPLKGNAYKKIFETYDICDYGWTQTWEQYWESCLKWHDEAINRGWGHYKDDLDEAEEYRFWYTRYKVK